MNKAFTLVELAIVIVIIGLLVGGVLQGQELIAQAKIRSQIKQLQEYDTGIISFRGKYDGLPGDILQAKATQLGLPSTAIGVYPNCMNANGKIEDNSGNIPIASAWCEPLIFFRQLSAAKVVKATFPRTGNQYAVGIQFPIAKMGNGGFLYTSMSDGGIYAFLGLTRKDDDEGANISQINLLSATPLFTAEESFQLDEKLDDGNPLQGKVRAVTNTLAPDTTTNECITSTTDQTYNISDKALRCRLVVRTSL